MTLKQQLVFIAEKVNSVYRVVMVLKEKLDLLSAEVVSYRKVLSSLEKVYGEIEKGLYGPVDDRAREAIREELDVARSVALRYDVLLERTPAKKEGEIGNRFSRD